MQPVVVESIVLAVRHEVLAYRVAYSSWSSGEYPDAEALRFVESVETVKGTAGSVAIEGLKDYIGPERNEILIAGGVDDSWYSHSTSWRVGRVTEVSAVIETGGEKQTRNQKRTSVDSVPCDGVGRVECWCVVDDKIPGGERYEIVRGGGIILTYGVVAGGGTVWGGEWRRVLPIRRQVQEGSVAPSAVAVDSDDVAVHTVRHLAFLLGRESLPDAVLADSKSNPVWRAIAGFDVGLAGVV